MKLFLPFSVAILSVWEASFVAGQGGDADDDVRPSPPSIGADIPVTYFGPPPSSVQKELIGPFQLLKSGVLDEDAGTITIPLYYGTIAGKMRSKGTVWYILTDTSDLGNAQGLGLNHSPKLRYANYKNAVRHATIGADGKLVFDDQSTVDFHPELILEAGDAPDYFPPTKFQPGSVGKNGYSPIMNLDGEFYNAPIVASPDVDAEILNKYCDGLPTDDPDELEKARQIIHDTVLAICPRDMTVTLSLTPGHSFARPVLYVSLDASTELAASLEGVTHAPGLEDVEIGNDDSFLSAVERLFAVTNGYTNDDLAPDSALTSHPQRNGFNSALRGDGGPLNVLGGIPTVATDYSPLWDVNIGEWTQEAIDYGYRARWLEEFQILGFVERGVVTGPGGVPFGSSGSIVNCPIVHRFL